MILRDEQFRAAGCSLVGRTGRYGPERPPAFSLAVSSRARFYLFLGILLPGVSNPRTPRPKWLAACRFLFAGSGEGNAGRRSLLVRADFAVAQQQCSYFGRSLLDRPVGLAAADAQSVAAWRTE